jgi:hypothetical protein
MEKEHSYAPQQDAPTPEEFQEARHRELARLNMRLSRESGKTFHTPADSKLLEQDTLQQEDQDKDTVRRWAARLRERNGSKKPA